MLLSKQNNMSAWWRLIKYKTNMGAIFNSMHSILMRLVGTRVNVFIVEQRKFIYCYYLIYINNATIRFLFALWKWVIQRPSEIYTDTNYMT